ncbi:MAG TPA: helix-turn-helix transcriptional regulator [Solirubrobacteraceae bacterium]|jgi:hypothetical protein|nr:helix-turn-helix transcriptional regulator [Solirubrobacteraceae bacterium]
MSANAASSLERRETLMWTARVGAVTADALAELRGASLASARAHLGSLTRAGLLVRRRLLVGEPSLYTITGAGLRRVEVPWSGPRRVSVANAPHTFACARAAAALQRGYPDHVVIGECELRRRERVACAPLASAALMMGPGATPLHRPDLVLWPVAPERLPVAVEVELTVKAPRRLAEICRAWNATSGVAGVLYLAPPSVRRALARAIALTGAERIVVLSLDSLAPIGASGAPIARTVPS